MAVKQIMKQDNGFDEKISELQELEYKGKVVPLNPKQKINDEELLAVFETIENRWYRVDTLAKALERQLTINVTNPKRAPIGSNYLRRLANLTGKKWRQKRALDQDGNYLVKIYVSHGRVRSSKKQ